MKVAAIVPSAGRGKRIKSKKAKPYLKLGTKPILAHTLKALSDSECIHEIVVAIDRSSRLKAERLVKRYKIKKVKAVIVGGATRFRSVLNCLKHVSGDIDYVVIHDGVRPLITGDIIKKAIGAAKRAGASVTGTPLIPTIKKIDKYHNVISTPPRRQIWVAQTPQVFKKALILKAYNSAKNRKLKPTDDSMLLEVMGKKAKMVMGSYRNIKITTPEDLKLAEILLRRKE